MKQILIYLLKVYLKFIAIFIATKPLFMLYHINLFEDCTYIDWLKVMFYGIPLDLSVAGYLTIIPVVIFIIYVWIPLRGIQTLLKWYFRIVSAIMAIIIASDLEL